MKKYSDEGHAAIDTSFSSLYKKLIHSSSLMSILNVEHAFAMAVQDVIRDRDRTIAELERRWFALWQFYVLFCVAHLKSGPR